MDTQETLIGLLKETSRVLEEEVKKFKSFVNRTANRFKLEKQVDSDGKEREFVFEDIEKEIVKLIETEDERDKFLDLWEKVAGRRDNFENQVKNIENWIEDYNKQPKLNELLQKRQQRIEELEAQNAALRKKVPSKIFNLGKWFVWVVKKVKK